MRTIQIHFDIKNAPDVVRSQKGGFIGLAADLFMGREKLKGKVEDAVAKELVTALQATLAEKLAEQGVQAAIVVEDAGQTGQAI